MAGQTEAESVEERRKAMITEAVEEMRLRAMITEAVEVQLWLDCGILVSGLLGSRGGRGEAARGVGVLVIGGLLMGHAWLVLGPLAIILESFCFGIHT